MTTPTQGSLYPLAFPQPLTPSLTRVYSLRHCRLTLSKRYLSNCLGNIRFTVDIPFIGRYNS